MSDYPENPARPVGLFTIIFLTVLFAAFFVLVRRYYSPTATAPQNAAAEKLPKEMEWRATAASRRAALNETREEQAKQAATYGWVDQKAGVVRLPIEQAMQLVVQEQGAKTPAPRGRE
jgi:hypothetical protein